MFSRLKNANAILDKSYILANNHMTLHVDLNRVLKDNSRTFFIPIARLPARLQETIASAYLCMRAIDEIEDHPSLNETIKATLLRGISQILQSHIGTGNTQTSLPELDAFFSPYRSVLPEVTLRIGDWLSSAPGDIAPRVWDATISMAERMAYWVENHWNIQSETDLDGYTFSVAGAVGLLICDIWGWFDGTNIDRLCAVQFGRGLQAVNILRNRKEDTSRGVNFFPSGWTDQHMFAYARKNIALAKAGVKSMPNSSFKYFVDIPLLLAEATMDAIENGVEKLSREQVLLIVGRSE
jgi:farnesyl-diphosphate farnesyltransferase